MLRTAKKSRKCLWIFHKCSWKDFSLCLPLTPAILCHNASLQTDVHSVQVSKTGDYIVYVGTFPWISCVTFDLFLLDCVLGLLSTGSCDTNAHSLSKWSANLLPTSLHIFKNFMQIQSILKWNKISLKTDRY